MKESIRLIYGLLFFVTLSIGVSAQSIAWKTLEEAEKLQQLEPTKPLFIDVYTTWCTWCKVMDKNTFSQSQVANYINKHFIPVKWDAQTKEQISFHDKTYAFNGYYNELTYYLLNDRLEFPSMVFVNSKGVVENVLIGYHTEEELMPFLRQFKGN